MDWIIDPPSLEQVAEHAERDGLSAELATRDAKLIRLSDTITGLRETCDDLRRQLSEARATLGVETARLNCLFDVAVQVVDGERVSQELIGRVEADEDEIAEIRRAWRQAIDAEMRKTDAGASDLHGCDPIREGSQETPEWENNPR
jgi:ABC-type transporter Mla subunit MlaD